jgi:hypothetical protein
MPNPGNSQIHWSEFYKKKAINKNNFENKSIFQASLLSQDDIFTRSMQVFVVFLYFLLLVRNGLFERILFLGHLRRLEVYFRFQIHSRVFYGRKEASGVFFLSAWVIGLLLERSFDFEINFELLNLLRMNVFGFWLFQIRVIWFFHC